MGVRPTKRVNGRTVSAAMAAAIACVGAACGGERSYDNPPEVPIGTASSTTGAASTAPTTTVFVPSTAPTTVAPPTNPPPPTPAPTDPRPPPTAPPTQAVTVPPTQPPTPVPTTGQRYTVVAGDTLFGIARKLGVDLQDLLAANGLQQSSVIVPGRQLDVPQGGTVPAATQPQQPAPTQATQPPTVTSPAPATTAAPATTGRAPTTTSATPAGAVVPQETSATCQAESSTEADGTPIDFAPGNVLDRNPATAWRCPAPATGESLTFQLDGPTQLVSVGLIGGYVKVDPLTGVDRFPQNHRVRRVTWTFSDGSTVTQDLDDSRQLQTIPVDATTTSVTLTIVSTYPPGGEAPRQMVPIAEVQLIAAGG